SGAKTRGIHVGPAASACKKHSTTAAAGKAAVVATRSSYRWWLDPGSDIEVDVATVLAA
ncbi:hypothetical protein E2562_026767, partial [Oryza meyeriana var. granulata]